MPAKGQAFYKGKPLEYGSVMFQPTSGQPARGAIQSDGTFVLTTFEEGDGATVGMNKVRVTCYEAQSPGFAAKNPEGLSMGRLMIPKRYTDFRTSGLEVEVKSDRNEPFIFQLVD